MSNIKEYQQEYHKTWYEQNKVKRQAQIKARKLAIKAYVEERKTACIRCGFNHPAALDFHHRDPNDKVIEVHDAVQAGWSAERIQAEINKCDLLCANCHRILHYDDRMAQV